VHRTKGLDVGHLLVLLILRTAHQFERAHLAVPIRRQERVDADDRQAAVLISKQSLNPCVDPEQMDDLAGAHIDGFRGTRG
jgi:hypothetical protein